MTLAEVSDWVWAVPAVAAVVWGLLLTAAYRYGTRRRLVDDLPTSKTAGVFVGLVELKGTAEAERPLRSHVAEVPCVWYQWTCEEHWRRKVVVHYTDDKGRRRTRTHWEEGWTQVDSGGGAIDFYLKDDTGITRIRPDGAKVEPQNVAWENVGRSHGLYYRKGPRGAISNSTGRRRFVESAVVLHAPLYVVGRARERDDAVAAEVAHDPTAEMFLISTRTEEEVSSGLAAANGTCLVVASWMPPAAMYLWDSVHAWADGSLGWDAAFDADGGVTRVVAAGVLGVAASVVLWAWYVANSMISLRQRTKAAVALVDVQLQRRRDLLPSLAAAVDALAGHERALQTAAADLRAEATRPKQRGLARPLGAVFERYPRLKADPAFSRLSRELIDTEGRVALSRAYCNTMTGHYNTRLDRFPDGFFARALGFGRKTYVKTDGFEREPVRVTLAV